jgi:hypothetical protein
MKQIKARQQGLTQLAKSWGIRAAKTLVFRLMRGYAIRIHSDSINTRQSMFVRVQAIRKEDFALKSFLPDINIS